MERLLNVATQPWVRVGSSLATAAFLVVDLMGLGDFPWQWAALGGLFVLVVATSLTIGKQQRELDRRAHFRSVADQLAGFLAEGDRMMTHIASGIASVFMDDVFKWVSRTHTYITEECGRSAAEDFLIIDLNETPPVTWEHEDGQQPLTPEMKNILFQVTGRMKTLRPLMREYRTASQSGGD